MRLLQAERKTSIFGYAGYNAIFLFPEIEAVQTVLIEPSIPGIYVRIVWAFLNGVRENLGDYCLVIDILKFGEGF